MPRIIAPTAAPCTNAATVATGDAALRDEMMAAISPFWDGNETWLVVIGASLFAAFPVVYAIFLPAFYIPVLLLLFGLIFRGVAFEYRVGAGARSLWDWGFFIGSHRRKRSDRCPGWCSWVSLISPRYSTCRCTTRPLAVRVFSTTLQ
jgi:hypothetical protein